MSLPGSDSRQCGLGLGDTGGLAAGALVLAGSVCMRHGRFAFLIMAALLDQGLRTPTQFNEEIEWTWFCGTTRAGAPGTGRR